MREERDKEREGMPTVTQLLLPGLTLVSHVGTLKVKIELAMEKNE